MHGKSYRRAPSETGRQLLEKQKIRFTYGLREEQMRRIFETAVKKLSVATDQALLDLLERRLDNVIYRLGLATSRSMAKQLVGHGHFLVNGKRVTVPSYLVRPNDVLTIRTQSKEHLVFKDLATTLKNYEVPGWLSLDMTTFQGTVLSAPKDLDVPFDINLVVDYYSQ